MVSFVISFPYQVEAFHLLAVDSRRWIGYQLGHGRYRHHLRFRLESSQRHSSFLSRSQNRPDQQSHDLSVNANAKPLVVMSFCVQWFLITPSIQCIFF